MNVRTTIHVRASVALLALAACQAPLRPIPVEQAAAFQPAVQLEAAGEPIDVTKLRGYPGPAVIDHDGDGKLDLLVGSFEGKILIHKNVGTASAPVFEAGEFLRAGGEDLHISNW